MSDAVIVALITAGITVFSNVLLALTNNRLTIYRIQQLEEKVSKHNNLIERVVTLESNSDAQWRWIDKLKEVSEKR